MLARILILVSLAACHPRFSAGYDSTARTVGPLAHLQAVSRIAAITGAPTSTVPPEGRSYAGAIGFGDKNFTLGLGVRGNNISKTMFDPTGPQYLSGAASLEFRYNLIRFKHLATSVQLAPTRTILVDSASGDYTWGSGVRFGGGLSVQLSAFSIYADAFQEKIMFTGGPADGISTRTGLTVGIAIQP